MSDTTIPARRIDDLPEADALTGEERLVVEQGAGDAARTRRVALADLAGFGLGGTTLLQALQALAAELPTTLPEEPGILWNNGGLLCIS